MRVLDHDRLMVIADLLIGIEQLEHSLRRCHTRLEEVDHRCDLGDGLGELAGVLDECLDVAERHSPAGHPQAANHGDDHVVQVPDEHHDRHDQTGEELGGEAGLVQGLVLLLEARLNLALAAEHLDQVVTGECLLDLGVEGPGATPLSDKVLLRPLHHRAGNDHGERDRHQGDQCQCRRDVEHHRDHEDDGEDRVQHLAHRLLQALGHVVDVIGDPAQQLTAGLAVEVTERKSVELVLDLGPHPEDGLLDHVVEQVPLEVAEQGRADIDGEGDKEHRPQRPKVDALAGDHVHRRQQVGGLTLAGGPCRVDRLGLGHPGWEPFADGTGEDDVGRPAQYLGPYRRQTDAEHRGDQHCGDLGTLGAKPAEQPLRRRPEIHRLLPDHPATEGPTTGTGAGYNPFGGLHRPIAHEATSALSCDSTISMYVGHVAKRDSWVPRPTTAPSSRTRIWSALAIVDTRWATITTVESAV